MPLLCDLTLDRVNFEGCDSASVWVRRGSAREVGYPNSTCDVVVFTIVRAVQSGEKVQSFRKLANTNGKRCYFDGELKFVDPGGNTLLTYEFERAFVASYELIGVGNQSGAFEHIEIRSGIVRAVGSNGNPVSFTHHSYDEITKQS